MKTLFLILTILTFSAIGYGQDLPLDFAFEKKDNGIVQMMPKESALLFNAELGKAYQALGIIAQPDEEKFGLMFVNAQNDYEFEKQADEPFIITIGERRITGSKPTIVKKDKVKKLKLQILTVVLTREDFEDILLADSISVNYGTVKYVASSANLDAFRYAGSQIESSAAQRNPSPTPSGSSGGSVSVKGYYRKDGTYVRPHTRKAPSRKH